MGRTTASVPCKSEFLMTTKRSAEMTSVAYGDALLIAPMGLPLESLPGHLNIKTEISENGQPIKKRQRLDHLSVEEKIMRRKLKNRVAAQCARDRKKAQMDTLEEDLVHMRNAMTILKKEKEALKIRNEALEKENAILKSKLQKLETKTEVDQEHQDIGNIKKSFEYASLINASQQKRQDSMVVAHWMMLFLGWMLLNLSRTSSTSFNSLSKNFLKKDFQATSQNLSAPHQEPLMKWWGPQQNSWNPSEN